MIMGKRTRIIFVSGAMLLIISFVFLQMQSHPQKPYCGDSDCGPAEDCNNCPSDCGACLQHEYCGDGVCEGGENCNSCPSDCGQRPISEYCGDGICSIDESCSTCPRDCGQCRYCGDGLCANGENCSSCPQDCGPCAHCGDGECSNGETELTCPEDCGRASECRLVMFHNGVGSMCIQQLEYIESIRSVFPNLVFEQHLTSEANYNSQLSRWMSKHPRSLGVSDDYGYYPITFINSKAYSGFNDRVKDQLQADLEAVCS